MNNYDVHVIHCHSTAPPSTTFLLFNIVARTFHLFMQIIIVTTMYQCRCRSKYCRIQSQATEEIKRLQRDAYNFQPVLELQNYFTQYRLTLIMSSTPFPTSWNPRWWSTNVPPDPAPPPISAPPHPTSPSSIR